MEAANPCGLLRGRGTFLACQVRGRRQNPRQPAPSQNRGCCSSRRDSGRRWNQTASGRRSRPHSVDRQVAGCRVKLAPAIAQPSMLTYRHKLGKLLRLLRLRPQAPPSPESILERIDEPFRSALLSMSRGEPQAAANGKLQELADL